MLLFIASLYFYAWGEKEKVFVMIGSILINYIVGLQIDKSKTSTKRKLSLTIGIIINILVLVYFKYTEFIISNINHLLHYLDVNQITNIKYQKLPLGISFYTFQSISYLVDVYRKEVAAQKNFLNLGLYIALFPQLIAGPIVRYNEIAEQLTSRTTNLSLFNSGIKRFIVGLGKKMLLANQIAYVVDEIYLLPSDQITFELAWLAAIGYALQIYFDFSGYSDMAIGLGRMFGFRIAENFNFPYIAKSIREFWTRWHISLSIWFRDYLYIPLGGNRRGSFNTIRNLIIVFLITGLWHGASWSFVFWGIFHGFFMILERQGLNKILARLPKFISIFYTLLVVIIGWVFFRVEDFSEALGLIKTMFGFSNLSSSYKISLSTTPYFWIVFIIGILICFPFELIKKNVLSNNVFVKSTIQITYLLIFVLSVMEILNDNYSPFIYFRF